MARVSFLKFELSDKKYEIPVNCGSNGIFKAKLPVEVHRKIGIIGSSELRFSTLSELESEFFKYIKKYKDANTTEELKIAIRYKSKGIFGDNKDGFPLFGSHGDRSFFLETQWDSIKNGLGFDFVIYIEEITDGYKRYYKAMKGKDFPFGKYENEPEKYFKNAEYSEIQRAEWVKIPYSDEALTTLELITENLRKLSESIFKFISKDPEIINQMLTSGGNPLALNP